MRKIYHVHLTDEERQALFELIHKGETSARKQTRARILLLADEDKTDRQIVEAFHTSRPTVARLRQRFVEGNLEGALHDKPRPGGKIKLDGQGEAHLVALACSDPPEGQARWTMQLLADRLIELGMVDSLSDETVRLRLKKTGSSPGRKNDG